MKRRLIRPAPLLALAVLLTLVVRRGERSVLASPQDIRIVSVSCASNPETTTIQNIGLLPVSLDGYTIASLVATGGAPAGNVSPFFPLPLLLSLNPGQQLTFLSGPGAPPGALSPLTLTRTYIYSHALARSGSEGAVLSFSGQAISAAVCLEGQATPTPAPRSTPGIVASPVALTSGSVGTTAPVATLATPFLPLSNLTPTPQETPSLTLTPSAVMPPVPGTTPGPEVTPSFTPSAALAPVITGAVGGTQPTPMLTPPSSTVRLSPGWNLVGATTGSNLSGAVALFAIAPDGSNYLSVEPARGLDGGQAYWAYFDSDVALPLVFVAISAVATVSLPLEPGAWRFVGNPSNSPVHALGADIVYIYDDATGYSLTSVIPPGRAAVVLSFTADHVQLTSTASMGSGVDPP